METTKAGKGRKRQTRKVVKQEEAAEASNQVEETLETLEGGAAPKPTISQRITQSLKQLSQLGAQAKQQDGEEVEQQQVKGPVATPVDQTAGSRQQAPDSGPVTPDTYHPEQYLPRRLCFGNPALPSPATAAVALAVTVLLLAAGVGHWRRERHAAGAVQQLGARLGTLTAAGAQQAEQLSKLQQAQQRLEESVGSLSSLHKHLQEAVASEAAAAATTAAAALQAQLQQLHAAVGQQAGLIQQLQEQQRPEGLSRSGRGASPPPSRPHMPPPGLTAEQVAGVVREEVQRALDLFEADRTGLVDYALASAGGRVLRHSQLTHQPAMYGLVGRLAHFLNPHELHPMADKFLLSPGNQLGECLPLTGGSGYVDLRLAHPILPTAFTYEHIPAAIALDIRTAPRTLVVYAAGPSAGGDGTTKASSSDGAAEEDNSSGGSGSSSGGSSSSSRGGAGGGSGGGAGGRLLGQLVYDVVHGRAVQTAPLAGAAWGKAVDRVRVHVIDNHGHPDYTCMYRIRVHGTRA